MIVMFTWSTNESQMSYQQVTILATICKEDFYIKDTQREKAPSNKAPALAESVNMDIWVVHT